MGDVTHLLGAAGAGGPQAAAALLPLVYDELRRLAAAKLAGEDPGQTLQPTALVHEAWLKIAGTAGDRSWNGRNHFFAAAAEAMRRILVDNARRKHAVRHGGGLHRSSDEALTRIEAPVAEDEVLAIHDSLDRLATHDMRKAELVKLRYFVGLTIAQTAEVLGISEPTAKRDWTYARAWLLRDIKGAALKQPG